MSSSTAWAIAGLLTTWVAALYVWDKIRQNRG